MAGELIKLDHMFHGIRCSESEYNYLLEAYRNVSHPYETEIKDSLNWFRTNSLGVQGTLEPQLASSVEPEYTGGSSSYYLVHVANPTTKDMPAYTAECNDIIEALGMNYAEGNAFKAIWRRAAAELGKVKKGYDNGLYDAEKVVFFGERMVVQSKVKKESH